MLRTNVFGAGVRVRRSSELPMIFSRGVNGASKLHLHSDVARAPVKLVASMLTHGTDRR
jgi:hypothetical protein